MTITSHIDIFAEILNSSFFTMKQSEIKKKAVITKVTLR